LHQFFNWIFNESETSIIISDALFLTNSEKTRVRLFDKEGGQNELSKNNNGKQKKRQQNHRFFPDRKR